MRYTITRTTHEASGYATCWYCGHAVVSPTMYTIGGHCEISHVWVCDAEGCTDAADAGTLDPLPESDD